MPVTVEAGRKIQFGKQTTFDTIVPGTAHYPGNLGFTEEVEWYEPGYPQALRSIVAGQHVNVRRGFTGSYESDLTFEEILPFLAMGLKGGVTAVGVGADKTWTFTPPSTGDPAVSPYTLEFGLTDFTTTYGRRVPNVVTTQMTLEFPVNAPAKFSAELLGGKVVVAAPTAALAQITGREIMNGSLTEVFIDDAFGGLGTTKKSGTVISARAVITTGMRPDYKLDGRAALDYGQLLYGNVECVLTLTMEYVGNADAEIIKWRDGGIRFIQLKNTGGLIPTTAINKSLKLNGAFEYVEGSTIGVQDGNDIVTLTAKSRYQAAYAKIFELIVVNALAALP